MVVKTDDVPDPTGQRPPKHTQKFLNAILHLTVIRLFLDSGIAILMLVAVLIGWPGLHEHLEAMGIYRGPTQ